MDALQQLRDLHLPANPGWWPPAPGWWLLAAAAVALIAWLARHLLQRWQRRAPFREARIELSRLMAAHRSGEINTSALASGANALLKRLCIHALHRPELAALNESDWLEILETHLPDESLRDAARAALGGARFQPTFSIEAESLDDLTGLLIRRLEESS